MKAKTVKAHSVKKLTEKLDVKRAQSTLASGAKGLTVV
jgi:hypothetical protein